MYGKTITHVPARIDSQDKLLQLQSMLGVSNDWHEPDSQHVTATMHGESFDNAGFWGSDFQERYRDTLDAPSTEMYITIHKDGQPVAEINLATLIALAANNPAVNLLKEIDKQMTPAHSPDSPWLPGSLAKGIRDKIRAITRPKQTSPQNANTTLERLFDSMTKLVEMSNQSNQPAQVTFFTEEVPSVVNVWAATRRDGIVGYFLTKEEIPLEFTHPGQENISGIMKRFHTHDVLRCLELMNQHWK